MKTFFCKEGGIQICLGKKRVNKASKSMNSNVGIKASNLWRKLIPNLFMSLSSFSVPLFNARTWHLKRPCGCRPVSHCFVRWTNSVSTTGCGWLWQAASSSAHSHGTNPPTICLDSLEHHPRGKQCVGFLIQVICNASQRCAFFHERILSGPRKASCHTHFCFVKMDY